MNMKEKLIKEYPLTERMECYFECYKIIKHRYVIFPDFHINEANKNHSLLDEFDAATKNFSQCKSLIIVGYTDEEFKEDELVYVNGDYTTWVTYYLKNTNNNEIYFNDGIILFSSLNWRKIFKRFNEILK